MRTGSPRGKQVIRRSKSAPQPLGRRRTSPRLALAALVAVGLSVALAGPALAGRAPEPPTVTNVVPRHATLAGGTHVTIIGTNFTGATAVKFGTRNAMSFTVHSSTEITATSPPLVGETHTVDVTVTTPSGTSATSPADEFHYLFACEEGHAPAVTSVEPHGGFVGTSVTIKGERFFTVVCTSIGVNVQRVLFGLTEATSFEIVKEGEIIAKAPPLTGDVDVTVESPVGQSPTNQNDGFNYQPPPTVTNVVPNVGPPTGGTTVTLTGTGFTGATAVRFGSNSATSFTVNSETSITGVSPKGTGTVDATVTTPAGTSPTSAADHFRYSKR